MSGPPDDLQPDASPPSDLMPAWKSDPSGYISHIVGAPIKIYSGYRSPEHNEEVGGARGSAHTRGEAFDFGSTDGTSFYDLAQRLASSGVPYDQLELANNHVHVSFDPRMRNQIIYGPGYSGRRLNSTIPNEPRHTPGVMDYLMGASAAELGPPSDLQPSGGGQQPPSDLMTPPADLQPTGEPPQQPHTNDLANQFIPGLEEAVTGGLNFASRAVNPMAWVQDTANTVSQLATGKPIMPDETGHEYNVALGRAADLARKGVQLYGETGLPGKPNIPASIGNPEDVPANTPEERALRSAVTLGAQSVVAGPEGGAMRLLGDIATGGLAGAAGSYAHDFGPDLLKRGMQEWRQSGLPGAPPASADTIADRSADVLSNIAMLGTGFGVGAVRGRFEGRPQKQGDQTEQNAATRDAGSNYTHMPSPGTDVGLTQDDGSVTPHRVVGYRAMQDGSYRAVLENGDGTHTIIKPDDFVRRMTEAPGRDKPEDWIAEYERSEPVTQAESEALLEGRNPYSKKGPQPETRAQTQARVQGTLEQAAEEHPENYQGEYERKPFAPRDTAAEDDIAFARKPAPKPQTSLKSEIGRLGKIQLVDPTGEVSPEGQSLIAMFYDRLPKPIRGRLSQIVDPAVRAIKTADALGHAFGTRDIFARPGQGGLTVDYMREALQEGANGGNWLENTPGRGSDITDLVDTMDRIADGQNVPHPNDHESEANAQRHADLQREMSDAGISSTDSASRAAKKLSEYRASHAQEVPEPPLHDDDVSGLLAEQEFGRPETQPRQGFFGRMGRLFTGQPVKFSFIPRAAEGVVHDLFAEYKGWLRAQNVDTSNPLINAYTVPRYLIDRGRSHDTESMVFVDPEGGIIHASTSNDPMTVRTPDEGVHEMVNPRNKLVLFHNHPNSGSLSGADLSVLGNAGMKWVVAIGHDGHFYAARLPDSVPAKNRTEYANAVGDAYMNMFLTHRIKVWKAVERGEMTMDQANESLFHVFNQVLAARGDIHYISSRDIAPEAQGVANEIYREEGVDPNQLAASVLYKDSVGQLFPKLGPASAGRSASEAGAGVYEDSDRPALAPRQEDFAEGPGSEREARATAEDFANQREGQAYTNPDVDAKLSEDLSKRRTDDGAGINRDAREMAQLMRRRTPKRMNPVNALYSFPRTLATLHEEFGRYYQAMLDKQAEGARRLADARRRIAPLSNLSPEGQRRVYAAAEYHRLNNSSVPDNAKTISVYNDKYPNARGIPHQGILELTPEETQGYHALQDMNRQFWTGLQEAWTRRLVGNTVFSRLNWTDDPTINRLNIQHAISTEDSVGNRKQLERALTAFDTMENQRKVTYVPLTRNGDYRVVVREKPGADKASLGGDMHKQVWNQWVPRPAWDTFKEDYTPHLRTTMRGEAPEWAKAAIADAERRFPDRDKYTIEHGWRTSKTDDEDFNPGDLHQLFQKVEAKVVNDMRSRNMSKQDAQTEFQRLYRETMDTFLDQWIKDRMAGYRRPSADIPGYSPDFGRGVGTYMNNASHQIANMIHDENIDNRYADVMGLDNSHNGVKDFTKAHKNWMDNTQRTLWDRLAGFVQKVGFAETMAGNPSTMMMFEMHTPQLSLPAASMGLAHGYTKMATQMARAGVSAHAAISGDMRNGWTVNLSKLKVEPDLKAALQRAEDDGLLGHGVQTDLDVQGEGEAEGTGLRDRGEARRIAQAADRIASSTIGVIDKASRTAMYMATYRLAKNLKNARDMALFWSDPAKGSMLYRAQREGTSELQNADAYRAALARGDTKAAQEAYDRIRPNPEELARFMVKEASGDYGRQNIQPLGRHTLGQMFMFLHGFVNRYLSSKMRQLYQHGPEGRAAVLKLLPLALLVTGVEGLPFTKDVENLVDWIGDKLTGHDPLVEYRIRQALASTPLGKVGSESVMRGPLGQLLDIDLTGRLGMGDVIFRELGPIIGSSEGTGLSALDVFGGRITNVIKRAKTGQGPISAGSEVLPSDLRNVIRAAIDAQKGHQTAGQRTPGRRLTPWELGVEGLGFRPESLEEGYQKYDFGKRGGTGPVPIPGTP